MTPSSKRSSSSRRRPKTDDATARDDRVADDAAVTALLDLLTEGVAGLPEALERAEEGRRARAEESRQLLGSRELKSAARGAPELGKSITSARKELDRQDGVAEQSIAELRDAEGEWLAAIKALREPRG